MLKLFYSPGACSLASHIALEEAGADYTLEKIDLRAGQQKTPEYLAVNPAGVTPALQTDRGVLTQNSAIMSYVAQEHPAAGLTPNDDPFELARMHAFNGFLASSVHPAFSRALFAGLEGQAREEAVATVVGKLKLIEDNLLGEPWVFGQRYTVSDGYLTVFTRWARQAKMLDPAALPKLNAHLDRVQARPAVRRSLEAEGVAIL
jgi:glutathione S-transferase